VERANDPDDPRAVQLALTPRGKEVVEAAVPQVRVLEKRHLEPLGGPDSEQNLRLRLDLQALLNHAEATGGTPAPTAFADG
jgi:DNA-binding MarR family transcriptional regulator